ncbi:MAG TPA: hypothetical protein PKW56_10030 [Clostridiales bacterium]|nr:hypothetical protein [Clostridiales bacterium]
MYHIKVNIPERFIEEKKYVFDIISSFTGIGFAVGGRHEDYELILPNGKNIVIRDSFFGELGDKNTYLDPELIPYSVKFLSCLHADDLPVIFGNDSFYENGNGVIIGADIVAGIFFMLSRWEEAVLTVKDDHGRFPGSDSYAVRHKLIRRPVVDEYVDFLVSVIRSLDPGVEIKDRESRVIITSDIDSFEKFPSGKTLKMFAGHLLKRYDPLLFAADLYRYTVKLFGAKDPYDTFERIYSVAEKFGTKPVFFILAAPEGPYNDGWFARCAQDAGVFHSLAEKGAGVGLHYGYFSLLSENNIKSEKFELEKKYGISAEKGRAHFLQFDVRSSYGILELSGIKEDFSMGYSRHAGFRCGTGRSFSPWDIDRKCAYDIKETPLVVMDTTLYAHNRMRKDQIRTEFEYFLRTAEKYGTDITLLIHNSSPAFVFEALEETLKNKIR